MVVNGGWWQWWLVVIGLEVVVDSVLTFESVFNPEHSSTLQRVVPLGVITPRYLRAPRPGLKDQSVLLGKHLNFSGLFLVAGGRWGGCGGSWSVCTSI